METNGKRIEWEALESFEHEASGLVVQISRAFFGRKPSYSLQVGKRRTDGHILPHIGMRAQQLETTAPPQMEWEYTEILSLLLKQAGDYVKTSLLAHFERETENTYQRDQNRSKPQKTQRVNRPGKTARDKASKK